MNGILGFNKSGSSINLLLAAYGNDVVNVGTGTGYSLNLDSMSNVEFSVFLDRAFIQNYSERPKTFDGTAWTTQYVGRCMTSKFIKNVEEEARIYLGFCKFTSPQTPLDTSGNAIVFPNRVFYSDLFVSNNLTWGLEWGTNGKTTAGSPFFDLAQPLQQDFIASNIKVGDPFTVTSGDSTLANKTFYVKNIVSNLRLEMTENFTVTASSLHFWVGSNWFDVGADNNDSITGLSDSQGVLIVSKLFSLFTYSGTSLKQIPDALGTSSQRSMLSTKNGLYYFHGSDPLLTGIYLFNGTDSNRVSRQIDPFIRGMDSNWYTKVCAWREGEDLRWYIDSLTNNNYDISMTKAVASINTPTNAWDVSPISDVILCAAPFKFGNEVNYYAGNDEGQVLKMGKGNNFNGDPIPYALETKVYYPAGTESINDFPRIQVIGRATKGVVVKYKLWNYPKEVDDNWLPLGQLDDDKTELPLMNGHKFASGLQLRFEGIDTLENDLYVEKFTIFYRPTLTRLMDKK